MKKILILLLILTMVFTVVGCGSSNEANNAVEETTNDTNAVEETADEPASEATNGNSEENTAEETEEESAEGTTEYEYNPIDVTMLDDANRPVVTIEFVDGNKIVLKLIPEIAPNTVNNYITLAQSGYYDGVIFHRIIKDFMIQGGDPDGTGMGGPGYAVKDEFFIQDDLTISYLSHVRGIISMAKTQAPDSAGSQFFIMHQDSTFLDGQYSSFGYVVEGLDVVDELAAVVVGENNKPVEDIVIKTITVELNGYEVRTPEKIEF